MTVDCASWNVLNEVIPVAWVLVEVRVPTVGYVHVPESSLPTCSWFVFVPASS